VVDAGGPGVDSRDEGKHTGRNDLLIEAEHRFVTLQVAMAEERKRVTVDSSVQQSLKQSLPRMTPHRKNNGPNEATTHRRYDHATTSKHTTRGVRVRFWSQFN